MELNAEGPDRSAAGAPGEPAAPRPSAAPAPGNPAPVNPAPGNQAPVNPAQPIAPPAGLDRHGRVKRTRVSGAWVGLVTATVVLLLLVIFIAQNTAKVTVHFLGFHGELSLGLMLLIAALCGVVIAALIATARILQLRKALKASAQNRTAAV